jgi:hypothetical protein
LEGEQVLILLRGLEELLVECKLRLRGRHLVHRGRGCQQEVVVLLLLLLLLLQLLQVLLLIHLKIHISVVVLFIVEVKAAY